MDLNDLQFKKKRQHNDMVVILVGRLELWFTWKNGLTNSVLFNTWRVRILGVNPIIHAQRSNQGLETESRH